MKLFNKSTSALEIGARTLKGITLKKRSGRIYLTQYFFHDLALDNELYPLEAPVEEDLKALVEVHKFAGKEIVSCLEDKDVLTHECRFPQMPKSDLDLAIKNEVEEHLSLSPTEAIYQPVLLSSHREDKVLYSHFQVYCTRRPVVEKVQRFFENQNLKLVALESGALARVAMLDHNGYLADDKCYVTIDFGESHTTATLIKGKKVLLNNVITLGMGMINKVLFETQGLPYQSSEEIKVNYDSQIHEDDLDDNHKTMDEVYYQIFYKIQRLVDFFKVHLKEEPIESILVTGGGSQVHHLDQVLQSYCGLKAIVVNPFQNIEIYSKENSRDDRIASLAPYMATVIGMALRGL